MPETIKTTTMAGILALASYSAAAAQTDDALTTTPEGYDRHAHYTTLSACSLDNLQLNMEFMTLAYVAKDLKVSTKTTIESMFYLNDLKLQEAYSAASRSSLGHSEDLDLPKTADEFKSVLTSHLQYRIKKAEADLAPELIRAVVDEPNDKSEPMNEFFYDTLPALRGEFKRTMGLFHPEGAYKVITNYEMVRATVDQSSECDLHP